MEDFQQVLTIAGQFGLGNLHRPASFLDPLLALAAAVAIGGALYLLLRSARRIVLAPLIRRRRLLAAATAEARSRAMMDELCPYGWHARIALTSGCEDEPDRRVVVEWDAVVPPGSGLPTVVRTVTGETIADALRAMVSDRITDETLQEIEQRARYDGVIWPDS